MDFLNAIVLMANFVFVPALTYGSQLALGAIFVTLIYGVLRFANFAYGDLMAFGTMISILITWKFQSMGISFGFLPTAILYNLREKLGSKLFFDKVIFEYYRIKKSCSSNISYCLSWNYVCSEWYSTFYNWAK